MATIAQDNFTEASAQWLVDHTPDTGTAWAESAWHKLKVHASDYLYHGAGSPYNQEFARETTTIGDDDMDVSCNTRLSSESSSARSGATGRIPSGEEGLENCYQAYRAGGAGYGKSVWNLKKIVASSTTSLGSWTETVASGTWRTVKLEIRAATKKLYVEGTQRVSSSDDSLTGNNYAGVIMMRPEPRLDSYLSESVGAATQTISPTGLASAEAHGTQRLDLNLAPTAIASAEALGTAVLTPGAVQILPSGIASAEALGALRLDLHITPTGIATAEALGTPALTLQITATAIASAEALGTAGLTPGAAQISPTGLASAEAIGVLRLDLQITPTAIDSVEALGAAVLVPGTVIIAPAGVASQEAIPSPALTPGVVQISPTGIVSAETLGAPVLTLAVDFVLEVTLVGGGGSVEVRGGQAVTADGATTAVRITGAGPHELDGGGLS